MDDTQNDTQDDTQDETPRQDAGTRRGAAYTRRTDGTQNRTQDETQSGMARDAERDEISGTARQSERRARRNGAPYQMPSPTGKQGKRNAMTIRKSDTRNRNAERNARRNARTTRKAIWHETQSEMIDTRRKAKRHIEERNEMSGEQSETVRIYLTPTREAPKELSTFSTMRKYNTQDRRRIASHGNIHNMNTNLTGSLISNWCSE